MIKTATEVLKEAIDKKCVISPSVHHTGTWFALEFLQWHSEFQGVSELRSLMNGGTISPHNIIHFHLTGNTIESRGTVDGIEFEQVLNILANNSRVIIPLRDPLKAIISRHVRAPKLDHRFIVDGFRRLHYFSSFAVFLPIDLYFQYGKRLNLLGGLLSGLGLKSEPYVYRFARDWSIYNTAGEYGLKHAYREKDLVAVKNHFPANYDQLMKASVEIIPFLQRIGYTDMPWWADARRQQKERAEKQNESGEPGQLG